MLDYERPSSESKGRADWTGLIVVALVAPVFFLFIYLGKPDMGFTLSLVLGLNMVAIKLRWKLRKHAWFWATIILILALHVPLFFIVRWPQSSVPTIVYSMPLGIADGLFTLGAISLARRLFSKDSPADEGDE